LCLAGLAAVAAPQAQTSGAFQSTAQGEGTIALSGSLSSSELSLGEPVILDVSLANESPEAVQFDLGQNRKENFLFVAARPDGTTVSVPRLRVSGFSVRGIVSIKPGGTYNQKLVLNEWIDFQTPGKYAIEVRLSSTGQPGSAAAPYETPPFRFDLEVLPRDAARLQSVCLSLALQVEQASSSAEAAESALALSYARDPVAVPYLERVLRSGWFVEGPAINALETIADAQAVRVLISALKIDEPPYAARLARGALRRIEEKTSDSALRLEIKRAIE
jgi:hypothetical protein